MDFAASLSADLSAALAVDVVEDRPRTGERHVCVRPVSAETVESVNIDEVQGHLVEENIFFEGRRFFFSRVLWIFSRAK